MPAQRLRPPTHQDLTSSCSTKSSPRGDPKRGPGRTKEDPREFETKPITSDIRQELKRGRSFPNAADGMHPAHLRIALRDALLMAAADGHYDAREMDVVKQLAQQAAFSPEDLEELYNWIDEGWNWMKKGRRVLSLPEEVHHWNTVYED